MKKYKIHCHIHMGADPIVAAETESAAIEAGYEWLENSSNNDYEYIEGVVEDAEEVEAKALTSDVITEYMRDPLAWADFAVSDEKLAAAIEACENTDRSFISHVVGEIISDGDADDEKLLRLYRDASKEDRKLLDAAFVHLCGWSLATLVEQFAKKTSGTLVEPDPNYRGKIVLSSNCDLTDPCYNKDVWCRTTVTGMKPGTYVCYARKDVHNHVVESWIIHEEYDIPDEDIHYPNGLVAETEVLTGCGVDSGLFGYFADKPDFTDSEWQKFCDSVQDVNFFRESEGFFTESGGSDGCYCPVLWKNREGEIIGIGTSFEEV